MAQGLDAVRRARSLMVRGRGAAVGAIGSVRAAVASVGNGSSSRTLRNDAFRLFARRRRMLASCSAAVSPGWCWPSLAAPQPRSTVKFSDAGPPNSHTGQLRLLSATSCRPRALEPTLATTGHRSTADTARRHARGAAICEADVRRTAVPADPRCGSGVSLLEPRTGASDPLPPSGFLGGCLSECA